MHYWLVGIICMIMHVIKCLLLCTDLYNYQGSARGRLVCMPLAVPRLTLPYCSCALITWSIHHNHHCQRVVGSIPLIMAKYMSATGWYSTTVFYNFFLTDIKKLINCKTQPFSSTLYIDILIFWCLSMVRWTKSCIPQHCQNIVISLSKLISTGLSTQTHLWTYLCTTVIPKYRLDNPKHHSRHPHMFKTDYRHQHTPTDTNRHHQTFSNTPRHHSGGGWQCLGVPGAVLGCLVLSGGW